MLRVFIKFLLHCELWFFEKISLFVIIIITWNELNEKIHQSLELLHKGFVCFNWNNCVVIIPTMLISLIFLLLHHCFYEFDLIFYTILCISLYFYYFSCKFSFLILKTQRMFQVYIPIRCVSLTLLQIFHGNCEDLHNEAVGVVEIELNWKFRKTYCKCRKYVFSFEQLIFDIINHLLYSLEMSFLIISVYRNQNTLFFSLLRYY